METKQLIEDLKSNFESISTEDAEQLILWLTEKVYRRRLEKYKKLKGGKNE